MNDSDEFGFFSNEEDLCGICLESIRVAFRTPGCNHKFHYRCLNKWYRSCYYENRRDPTCPLCKRNVLSTEHLNVHKIGGVYLFNPKNTDNLYYNIECYNSEQVATVDSYSTNNKPKKISITEYVKEEFKSMCLYDEYEDYSCSEDESEDISGNTEDMKVSDLKKYVEICGYSHATFIYLIEIGYIHRRYRHIY